MPTSSIPAATRRLRTLAATTSVIAALAGAAHGQGKTTTAAEAYTRGQEATLSGDHVRAAELYELADGLAPSAAALRSALRARFAADQLARAATLASVLLARYPDDQVSRELAEEILDETAPGLARFDVRCAVDCLVSVNGLAAGSAPRRRHVFYIEPGRHRLGVSFGSSVAVTREVDARAGADHPFELAPPADATVDRAPPPTDPREASATPAAALAADPEPARDRGGGSWLPTGVAAAVTVLVGGAAIWTGLDTLAQRDAYDAALAAQTLLPPGEQDPGRLQGMLDDGRAGQLRTNLLLGATAVGALATGVLFYLRRDDRAAEVRAPVVAPLVPVGADDPAGVTVRLRF